MRNRGKIKLNPTIFNRSNKALEIDSTIVLFTKEGHESHPAAQRTLDADIQASLSQFFLGFVSDKFSSPNGKLGIQTCIFLWTGNSRETEISCFSSSPSILEKDSDWSHSYKLVIYLSRAGSHNLQLKLWGRSWVVSKWEHARLIKKVTDGDFPGGSVAKTLSSHAEGLGRFRVRKLDSTCCNKDPVCRNRDLVQPNKRINKINKSKVNRCSLWYPPIFSLCICMY